VEALMSMTKYLLGGVALVALTIAGVLMRPMAVKPVVEVADYGYFYRLNVKVSHQDEMFDMNIVVTCNPARLKQFGIVMFRTQVPIFYAERTKNNHAIGVRPTLGCDGHTTENGGAPPDLLPAIRWYPDADDMTFAILYATEDAYTNPLSQLKLHGATMHKATLEEFLAFQEAAKTKSIVPVDGSLASRPADDLIVKALDEKAPKLKFIGAELDCEAVAKLELSEATREIFRKYWPAHKPKFWSLDDELFDKLWQEALSQPGQTFWRRNPLINDKHPSDFARDFAGPGTDGFRTRAGGGALRVFSNGRVRPENNIFRNDVPTLYPVQYSASFKFYEPNDPLRPMWARIDMPMWARIDMQGGNTQGFAYCQYPSSGLGKRIPSYETRPFQTFLDQELISTRPPSGSTVLYRSPRVFEHDQFLYMKIDNRH
jgi:hypothetical protein